MTLLLSLSSHGEAVTEKQYNKVLDEITKLYSDSIKEKGINLILDKRWESDSVVARMRSGELVSDKILSISGGFVRRKNITSDGLALVTCHEIGHLIGGTPLYSNTMRGSAEGQADYFATSKCLKRYFFNEDNISITLNMIIDDTIKLRCSSTFHRPEESAICIRISMAALAYTRSSEIYSGTNVFSSLNTPSKEIVNTSIIDDYPSHQCRLDTYLAGALCSKGYFENLDDYDFNAGACTRIDGYKVGNRPLCWYKP